jgi:hypothetical protein
MTTVSMDHTTATKFTLTSFSWGGSHIHYTLAVGPPRIGDEQSPESVAGTCRSGGRAG